MSLREFTKHQFQDASSIDGSRIDGSLEDLVQSFNAVEPRWLEYRWLQRQYVRGYIPLDSSHHTLQPIAPWMPICNANPAWSVGAPDGAPFNKWRYKGTDVGLELVTALVDQQWGWESAHFFERPVILQGVCWVLHTGTEQYNNDFEDAEDNSLEDFIVEVSVDNPFSQETRSQGAVEVHKLRFKASSVVLSQSAHSGVTGMKPSLFERSGICIHLDDLNIPIPRKSRVREALIIPSTWAGVAPDHNTDALQKQFYSATMTVLEAIL